MDPTLVIKLLASASSASASFTGLGSNIGAILGLTNAGSATGAGLQASADFPTAMSKVQQTYIGLDVAPAMQKYIDASNKVLELSDKVNEFVEASLRPKASLRDLVDDLASGQRMAMIDKMFSQLSPGKKDTA